VAPKLGVSVHWRETGAEDPAARLARLVLGHERDRSLEVDVRGHSLVIHGLFVLFDLPGHGVRRVRSGVTDPPRTRHDQLEAVPAELRQRPDTASAEARAGRNLTIAASGETDSSTVAVGSLSS
jgi:hypothetical protein